MLLRVNISPPEQVMGWPAATPSPYPTLRLLVRGVLFNFQLFIIYKLLGRRHCCSKYPALDTPSVGIHIGQAAEIKQQSVLMF